MVAALRAKLGEFLFPQERPRQTWLTRVGIPTSPPGWRVLIPCDRLLPTSHDLTPAQKREEGEAIP